MCGIAGIVGIPDRSAIERMTGLLAHRGPDDSGSWVSEEHGVALGHRRLSIIDLTPGGHQPMSNHSGNLWITFNGEIYNYRDLRSELVGKGYPFRSESDTEVLLAAYETWGERCLNKLNGMFAFAIYDCSKRRLFAARDRVGIKPFYYWYKDGVLVFASEIKAILAYDRVEKRPDYAALRTPVRFQVSPFTGFQDITKLPPGHFLTLEKGRLSERSYWDISVTENNRITESEAIEQLDTLLNDAVRLQMVADVPVGLFLSGGLDSSLIGALMRKRAKQDIHAFTIRFSDADQRFERMPDDSLFARRVAKQFGFQYHEFEIEPRIDELLPNMVWHLDEPLSDPAAINTFIISQAARDRGMIVLLNGMGGDEVFGGYRKHLACLRADPYFRMLPNTVKRLVVSIVAGLPMSNNKRGFRSIRWIKRFLSFAGLPEFERYIASDLSLSQEQYKALFGDETKYADSVFYKAQKSVFESAQASYLTKMCLNDTKYFLPEHNLTYSDKASMAVGVESRPPLTDHRIVELMFSLPTEYRIRGNKQKFLLKKVAERYLPNSIVHRPKAAFGSPLRSWIKGPLAPLVDELLSSNNIKRHGLYNPGYVKTLIERDRQGLDDNALIIWTLLTTELWFRLHFG
jgi:asparagine synthase (glutamine-hydrolysing)